MDPLSSIDYGDPYKFKTSLGIVLILAGFLIFFMYVHYVFLDIGNFVLNFDPSVLKEKGYSPELIQMYLEAYSGKLKLMYDLLTMLPFVCALLEIYGIYFYFAGMKTWKKKQKIRDDLEELELDIRRAQLRKLTESEVKNEISSSIPTAEELKEEAIKPTKNKESLKNRVLAVTDRIQFINFYYLIEGQVLKKLNSLYFGTIVPHVKLKGGYTADGIIYTYDKKQILVEIKLFRKRILTPTLNRILEQLFFMYQDNKPVSKNLSILFVLVSDFEGLGDKYKLEIKEKIKEFSKDKDFPIDTLFFDLNEFENN